MKEKTWQNNTGLGPATAGRVGQTVAEDRLQGSGWKKEFQAGGVSGDITSECPEEGMALSPLDGFAEIYKHLASIEHF